MRQGAALEHHGHPLWVEVELLALSQCVARRFKRSDEGEFASKSCGFFLDGITPFMADGTRSCNVLGRVF